MHLASSVTLIGPPFIDKETATCLFIAEGLKKGGPAVIVTTSHPPFEIDVRIAPIMPAFKESDQLSLVHGIDASGGPQPGNDASSTIPVQCREGRQPRRLRRYRTRT